jgi:hypothetical protein
MKTAYPVIRERSIADQHALVDHWIPRRKWKRRSPFLKSLNLKKTFRSNESSLVWIGSAGTKEKQACFVRCIHMNARVGLIVQTVKNKYIYRQVETN